MGKNGEKVLEDSLNSWEFDFEKKQSITNEDSFLLNIKNIAIEKLYSLVPDEQINTDVVITKLLQNTDVNISYLDVESYAKDKEIR